MRCGGTGPVKEATEDVQQVCNQIKDQAEKFLERSLSQFQALSYRPQVVAGTNYFVKVDVGDGAYLHLRIYKNLQGEVTLSGLQQDKTALEEIAYFEKHID